MRISVLIILSSFFFLFFLHKFFRGAYQTRFVLLTFVFVSVVVSFVCHEKKKQAAAILLWFARCGVVSSSSVISIMSLFFFSG